MSITTDIQRCTKCLDERIVSHDTLIASKKPYVEFNVEEEWKRDRVSILLIAESPPWNGKQRYFYNQKVAEKRTNLRKEVLKYLGLQTLEEFRDNGYFLVDAIKCRLNKSQNKSVPSLVLRNCAHKFLHKEIVTLNPTIIFVLGNSAKKALEEFSEFQELKKHNITDDYDKKTAKIPRNSLSISRGSNEGIHQRNKTSFCQNQSARACKLIGFQD
jgi:uracil-DNA glycosylase